MKKKNNAVVCKQCGKIIVGSSKAGLCESCFNKDAGVVVAGAAATPFLIKMGKKYGPKVFKGVKTVISLLRK